MNYKLFKKLLLLLIIGFASYQANAETDPDTNYVQKFKNIFAVKGFVLANGFNYTLTPHNNETYTDKQLQDAQVIYSPYVPTTVGLSFNIKGIGFSYVFKLQNDFLDTIGRAKSGFKQFQMNMYGSKFGLEAYYQDYKRFYFHYKGDNLLLKNYNSDIRAYQWGVNFIFIKNGKKFSYNAAFNQTQLQKKSAGSWLFVPAIKFNEIKSGHLIPDSVSQYYGSITDLQRNRNYSFLLQYGYGFNLTKNNFYFSGALMGGPGIQRQSYSYPQGKLHKTAFPLTAKAKAGLGYNGKVFFTGVFANVDLCHSTIQEVKTQQLVYSYGVYIGFRAIEIVKTRGQLKNEAKQKKLAVKASKDAEKQAAKKLKEDKKKAAAEKKKK